MSVTYANAFINAGFSSDTIMMKEGNDELEWVFKNKDYGQIASVASVGMLLLWNIDAGFEKIDKYMDHNNDLIRAGSYIAVGLVNSGIKNINDPVFALLQDKLEKNQFEKVGALMGLSLTYAGSNRQDIIQEIIPMILDMNNDMEVIAVASLALGLICIASKDEGCLEALMTCLMTRE